MVYQRYTPPTFIPLTAALIHHRVEGGPRCRRFLKTEREFQPRYGVGKAVKEDIPLAPVPWSFPESLAGLNPRVPSRMARHRRRRSLKDWEAKIEPRCSNSFRKCQLSTPWAFHLQCATERCSHAL